MLSTARLGFRGFLRPPPVSPRRFSAGPARTAGSRARHAGRQGGWLAGGAAALALGAVGCSALEGVPEAPKRMAYAARAGGAQESPEERYQRRREEARRRHESARGDSLFGSSGKAGGKAGDADSSSAPPPPAERPNTDWISVLKSGGAGLVLAAAVFGAFALSRYQRCSPNEVLVVFGLTGSKRAKLVHGGGTFVWPIIQEFRALQLEPFAVEVPLEKALSLEKVRVSVPSVFTLAIGTEVRSSSGRQRRPAAAAAANGFVVVVVVDYRRGKTFVRIGAGILWFLLSFMLLLLLLLLL